ncbi:MAG: hypothetical protein ACREFE_06830 [Limisphaerales bacterium]
MNLAKLLAAGKSIVNGRGAAAYREDKRVYLPKFGPAKNPLVVPAKTAAKTKLPKAETKNPVALDKKIAAPVWTKTQKLETVSATQKPTATWASRLNPISMLRGSRNKTAAQTVSRPVQAELSLEKVKVVHNDLTDAEVEIVPMKSRPAREPYAPVLPPARQSWEFLGERLLEVKVF